MSPSCDELIPWLEFANAFCYILEPYGAVAQLGERLTGSQKVVGSNPISSTSLIAVLKTPPRETGIRCNPHSFRRGFAVHLVKSGLSTRVVQSPGGWESIAMVERYAEPPRFADALQLYRQLNGHEA